MNIRISSILGLFVAVASSVAIAQQQAPDAVGSEASQPTPSVGVNRPEPGDAQRKSTPQEMQAQLKSIAEQLTASGLSEEARTIRELEQRVGTELFQKLLAAHDMTEQQIAIRIELTELSDALTPVDLKSLMHGIPANGTLAGILPTAEVVKWIDSKKEQGMIKIVSSPSVTILSGRTARFLSGGEVAVPTPRGEKGKDATAVEYRAFGTSALVTAIARPDQTIRLSAVLEHSEQNGEIRRIQTEVELRDGQSMVSTGLSSTASVAEVTRIPVLGDLPAVGRFFTSKKTTPVTTRLMFVITPQIVAPLGRDEVPPITGVYSEPVKPARSAK